MKRIPSLLRFSFAWLLGAGLAAPLFGQVIVNGGFESGLAGWTVATQVGSEGSFTVQSGTSSPANGFVVPAPPEGLNAAMSDGQGPGSRVLFQDFSVPTGTALTLHFSLFVANDYGALDFVTPDTLDFATPALNQRARVDLMTTASDPFSLLPGDVVFNVFETAPGSPLVTGYNHHVVDVTPYLMPYGGGSLRLRFTAVDNVAPMNVGVDHVAISVPDSLPFWVWGALALAVAAMRRRAPAPAP